MGDRTGRPRRLPGRLLVALSAGPLPGAGGCRRTDPVPGGPGRALHHRSGSRRRLRADDPRRSALSDRKCGAGWALRDFDADGEHVLHLLEVGDDENLLEVILNAANRLDEPVAPLAVLAA